MLRKKAARPNELPPDLRPITALQATRLAALSDVDAKELTGLTVADISEKFKWRIDLQLLLFRRICGKVVKKDPVTGIEYPVPFATVHVEDTDCNLISFFPHGSKWGWFFPFFCRREEIATVTTDECGRFCVYVPRWDIDWILRWRRERICFPSIFVKPSLRDILEEITIPELVRPPRPNPPDPGPFRELDRAASAFRTRLDPARRLDGIMGQAAVAKIAQVERQRFFGADALREDAVLDAPAFDEVLAPPLPDELKLVQFDAKDASRKTLARQHALTMDDARALLAQRLKLDTTVLAEFDLRRVIGPFRRCFDIFIPEWTAIFDVPDITFRVTQDVNGDGTEETIYSEGYFDVRWNAGTIPNVTLLASPIALASHVCDVPNVPCGNVPAILFAGLMPLFNQPGPAQPHFDAINGYAQRPNRPHPSGNIIDPLPNPAATAPFTGTLQLYGCHRTNPGATHYRVMYSYSVDGVTFSSFVPFLGLTWPLHRPAPLPHQMWTSHDATGWYPILPQADNWFPDNLLLEWNTALNGNGVYRLQLEVGTGGAAIAQSAVVAMQVDNSAPIYTWSIGWRPLGSAAAFTPIAFPCPVVRRGVIPQNIEFQVGWQVNARHLRHASISAGGCGAGAFALTSAGPTEHWHTSQLDNAVLFSATYTLPSVAAEGTYAFSLHASSRTFNPSAGDGGHLVDYEYDPIYLEVNPSVAFSVINANG